MSSAELDLYKKSCVYASLAILDSKQKITHERLTSVLKAAGSDVEAYFINIFTQAISQCNPEALLNVSVAASTVPATSAQAQSQPAEAKKVETKEESEEEESDDGAELADLFG